MKRFHLFLILFSIFQLGCRDLQTFKEQNKVLEIIQNNPKYQNSDNQFTCVRYDLAKEEKAKISERDKALFDILNRHMDEFGIKNIDSLMTDFEKTCTNKDYKDNVRGKYNYLKKLWSNHTIKTYKKIDEISLDAHIFFPNNMDSSKLYPVMILFHGGGWTVGSIETQLEPAKQLSSTGIIVIVAEYRLVGRHGCTVVDCVEDTKSIIRWTRKNSTELNIDENKIIAAGFSAGGHLVACAGMIDGFENQNEDLSISSKPNQMILYSPLIDPINDAPHWYKKFLPNHISPEQLSPIHNIDENVPASVILHGTKDRNCSYMATDRFVKNIIDKGYKSQLYPFEGYNHYLTSTKEGVNNLMNITVDFLKSLGYIQ